jgi:hypothetical protein
VRGLDRGIDIGGLRDRCFGDRFAGRRRQALM